MEKAKKRILSLSIIFLVFWALCFGLKYVIQISKFDLDTKLKLDLGVVILTTIWSIFYTLILINFLRFIKKMKNTNLNKFLNICYALLIINLLILITNAVLDGVIAFIHYLGLVNYAEFEQYQYNLDFIRIFIKLVYGMIVSYYIIKLESKYKNQFYLYLIVFWLLLLLPYVLNNLELHIPMLLRDSLWTIEVGIIYYIAIVVKFDKIESYN